jgi:D-mannonate dehydratase
LKPNDLLEISFEELVETNPTYRKVVEAVKSIKRSIAQHKPQKGKKSPRLSIAAIAEKAGIERKTIYNNTPLLNWLQTQITLQSEQKKARLEVSAASVNIHLEELPTNSLKKIQSLRERLKAEKEKNQILLGKMAELKLEQQMYKQRIADLEEFISRQNEDKIVKLQRQPD